jgi:hypothetical protein
MNIGMIHFHLSLTNSRTKSTAKNGTVRYGTKSYSSETKIFSCSDSFSDIRRINLAPRDETKKTASETTGIHEIRSAMGAVTSIRETGSDKSKVVSGPSNETPPKQKQEKGKTMIVATSEKISTDTT